MDSKRLQERWNVLAKRLGSRYRDCRLSTYTATSDPQQAAVNSVREYCENVAERTNEGQCVWLYGPPGTGKDHLMVTMMRAAVGVGAFVRWNNGGRLFSEFRDAIKGSDSESKLLERYSGADVLAVSDPIPPFGSLSEYQASMFFEIVDRRYRDMRPTWLTINAKDRTDAEQKIGTSIIDRLGHNALAIPCNWESYRR